MFLRGAQHVAIPDICRYTPVMTAYEVIGAAIIIAFGYTIINKENKRND